MTSKIRILSLSLVLLCFGVSTAAAAQADPSVVGGWSVVPDLPFYPVHVHVLPTGEVMIWPGDGGISGNDPRLWDPVTQNTTPLTKPGYDLFCSSHSFLADGQLLVAGGHIQNGVGLPNVSTYNPFTDIWTALPNMNAGRWYPTSTTLANGDMLVTSGNIDTSVGVNPLPQVFQVQTGTWRDLTNAQLSMDLYPRMHLAPNGMVFNSSPSTTTRYLDTAGTGAWTVVASGGLYRDFGSSVMYDDGKILIMGGGDPPTNTAEVIDLNSAFPAWRSVAPMAFARRQLNATILPDGKVLVNGGTSGPGFNNPDFPVNAAEMWDPATETWTTMASAQIPRLYHSAAALLPDGRVLSTGGNGYPQTEVYEPPYLFQGVRPTISSAPASVTYGETFFVQTPDGASVTQVTLVRLSSVTHAFNTDQRINRLSFSQAAGGLNVVAPSSPNLAPGGYYMLFLLDSNGVPSVGRIVRITSTPAGPAPVPTLTSLSPNNATAGGGPFTLTVNGSNFIFGSEVQWNGTARRTTFVSSTQLAAAISTSDIAVAGTASVAVVNPAPGGGASNALIFTINEATVTTGLVAAYSFDEGSGTTVTDSSGYNNTGTINRATWTTQGKYGNALSFDGFNDYVSVPNSSSLDISGTNITISLWANITNTGNDYVIIGKPWFSSSMEYPYYQYGIEFDGNEGKTIDFYFGDTSGTLRGPFSMTAPLGAWTHIAFTYNGNTVKGYVDGVQKLSVSATQSIQARANDLRIGVDGAFGQAFAGRVDEVRIYKRALSATEIQNDMNTPIGVSGPDTAPPDTSITGSPANPSNSSSASFSFTSTEAGSSFQCQLDGGGFVACTSPQSYTGLGNGVHTFQVQAIDLAGNVDPTPASYTWTIDSTAPDTTITASPPAVDSSTSASFSFTSTEGGSTFECKLDAGTFAACASPQSYSALAAGSHTFQVRATDPAGNTDPTPASYTWTINTALPDTTITANPAAVTNSTSASFSFTSTAANSTFECKLDIGAFAACTSPQSYSALAAGSHTFQVRATDTVGNTDPTPASYTWTIDTTAPDTTITANPPAVTNSTSASFSFTSTEAGSTFECKLDIGAFAACTSPQSYSALAAGSHTFQVRATDTAGNVDPTPASYSWTIDTTAPDTTITASPPTLTIGTSASFSFTSTEAGSTFECKLDAGAFASCTSPQSYSNLGDGSHTFQVRATDPAGNTDPTPASYTWTIDTAPPDTSITASPTNPSNSSSANFSFTSTEAGSSFQCQLDGGVFVSCTSPQSYSGLGNGSHAFQVRAIDLAGNIDPTPAGYTWTIDTIPPDTTITASPSNPSNSSSPSFSFTSTETGSFQCQLDGGGFAACTSPRSYSNLGSASHTFQVRAIDQAGNIDPTPASYTWTIDTTPPDTTITAAPSNPTASSSASFSFASTKAGSIFQCALDGATFAACTSPKGYTALASGSHTFQVRAIDPAGNVDPTPASYTWTYTPVTRFPDSTTINVGSLRSGTAASLSANDNNFYQVNSTTSGTRTTSWYGSFNAVPSTLSNLKATYRGKNSQSCTQTIEIWRWTDSTWVQLNSRSVGNSEVSIANLAPAGAPGQYVNGATGELRVQVRCTRSGTFYASGELMNIVYDTP